MEEPARRDLALESAYFYLIFMRFQVHHRATPREPDLPPETEVAELGQLLDVFAPETSPVEQMVTSSVTTASIITTDLVPVGHETSSSQEETLYEHYVAAFGGPTHRPSRSTQPSVPCGNHPCQGRSHPPDLCCICYAPHPWAKCWHMNGLPEREATRCKEYKAMADCGNTNRPLPSDAKRGVSSIQVPGVTFEDESVPSTKSPVDIDVEDVQLHMLLSEANATGSE